MVGNVTKLVGNHSFKFGIDVRRAYNLRVPSDAHRSGELTFNADRTSLNGSGGMGLATFLLGDVTAGFGRYVSPNTDARERQWRHFYYAQDTWRATPKLTLNYGLRLDVINPQTRQRGRQRRRGSISPPARSWSAGVGDVEPVRQREEPPELGAARRRDLPDRTRRRSSAAATAARYDIGVFGSLFGHSRDAEPAGAVGAAAERAVQLRPRVHSRAGPAGPATFVTSSTGRFPLPNGVSTFALPARSSGRRRWTRTT